MPKFIFRYPYKAPCPPCIIKTEFAMMCHFNLKTGEVFSCTRDAQDDQRKVPKDQAQFAVRGIQKIIRYDVIHPTTSEVILIITQQKDFSLTGLKKDFNPAEDLNHIWYLKKENTKELWFNASNAAGQDYVEPKLDYDFNLAWRVTENSEHQKALAFRHDDSSFSHSGSSFQHNSPQFFISKFNSSTIPVFVRKETNGKIIFELEKEKGVVLHKNAVKIFSSDEWIKRVGENIPHLPGGSGQLQIAGEIKNSSGTSSILPVNPQSPVELEPSNNVDYLDYLFRLEFVFTFSLLFIILISGYWRHGRVLYYFNVWIVLILAWDFVIYILDFSSARKRKNSDSGYTSVDMKPEMDIEAFQKMVCAKITIDLS